ncbi:MAG: MoaD/ThiS family protein [Candidatus Syntropharchaeales archaeon]
MTESSWWRKIVVIVKVKPLDIFQAIIGETEVILELDDGTNILDLLKVLKAKYKIYERMYLMIMKNGRHIRFLAGGKTQLENNDIITIASPSLEVYKT